MYHEYKVRPTLDQRLQIYACHSMAVEAPAVKATQSEFAHCRLSFPT